VTAAEIDKAVIAAGLKPVRPSAAQLLASYLELLLRWNAKLNLTSVREPSQIVRRHFIDCLQCAQVLPKIQTLLDFGSGAGLPGIPIAIARPEIEVTLGESQGKKAAFLREAVRVLQLNAQVYDRRIEDMLADRIFDAVTLRAVDRMGEAAQIGFERVRPGGWLVLFATAGTEATHERAFAGADWKYRLPIPGLETGVILFGQRQCST
jgi:16S rRNA (guanine527-N7)-methyltransferase